MFAFHQDWSIIHKNGLNTSGWVINDLCFLKASCNYSFQTGIVLNATGNYQIRKFLHSSFFFSVVNVCVSRFYLWFRDPKMEGLKVYIQHVMLWVSNNKMLQKQLRKCVVLMTKGSLLTTKCDTDCHNISQAIGHWEINTMTLIRHRSTFFKRIGGKQSAKSTWELTLDLIISQSTMCHHLKKIGKVSNPSVFVLNTLSPKNREVRDSMTSFLSKQWKDTFLN